jgi:uncharacterized membrane protein
MKKTALFFIIILTGIILNAQVTSSNLISQKIYNDKNQTTYLELSGFIPEYAKEDLTKQIENHPDINKFSFYDNTNIMKCMFTSELSINKKQVVDLINDIISDYSLQKVVNNNSTLGQDNSLQVLKFNILNIKDESQKQQALNALMENDWVSSANINSDNVCKLVLMKEMQMEFIVKVFEDLGLNVSLIDKL